MPLNNKPKKFPPGYWLGLGIAIGIPIGLPIGLLLAVLMDNMTIALIIGPALGAGLGTIIGTFLEFKHDPDPQKLNQKEKKLKLFLYLAGTILILAGVIIFLLFYFNSNDNFYKNKILFNVRSFISKLEADNQPATLLRTTKNGKWYENTIQVMHGEIVLFIDVKNGELTKIKCLDGTYRLFNKIATDDKSCWQE